MRKKYAGFDEERAFYQVRGLTIIRARRWRNKGNIERVTLIAIKTVVLYCRWKTSWLMSISMMLVERNDDDPRWVSKGWR